jgi:cobalamin synthase
MCVEHDVGNAKKKNHAVPSVDKLLLKQKKLHVCRDIQYGPLLFFLIVLYLILKTISLEQLTTERQGYKFLTVYEIGTQILLQSAFCFSVTKM